MIVSIFSVNVVAVMFINLAVLMKVCFARIYTCLCEVIDCAGEERVGLYRQILTVEHTQPSIQLITFLIDQRVVKSVFGWVVILSVILSKISTLFFHFTLLFYSYFILLRL